MTNTTWRVDITMTQLEGRVTAEARLASGVGGMVGMGHARAAGTDEACAVEYTLAARRSLEALGHALDYAMTASDLSSADQA